MKGDFISTGYDSEVEDRIEGLIELMSILQGSFSEPGLRSR